MSVADFSSPSSPQQAGDEVVITGVGVITAMGCGWEANVAGLRAGRVALGPVSVFDVSRQAARLGGEVALPPALGQYIVDLVASSRPSSPTAPDFVKDYIVWGAGLRASQNIALAAKSLAAQDARTTVNSEDVRRVIHPVLRHRIGLSFRAEVDHVSVDDIIRRLIEAVPAVGA